MSRSNAVVASRQLRVVAASMVEVILVASGWAAEKVYETVKRYHATETIVEQELPSLDGKGVWSMAIVTGTTANNPQTSTDPDGSVASMR